MGTAIKDDPLLTVRRVEARARRGSSSIPVADYHRGRVLTADGIRRLVITGPDARTVRRRGRALAIDPHEGQLAPAAIIAALAVAASAAF